MKSRTTARFRRAYDNLPENIRKQARDAYQLFIQNPNHPSLRFRQIHPTRRIYSVRITRAYRALGVRENDVIIWFWIGSHDDYYRLLKRG
jgi:hypothetical protein